MSRTGSTVGLGRMVRKWPHRSLPCEPRTASSVDQSPVQIGGGSMLASFCELIQYRHMEYIYIYTAQYHFCKIYRVGSCRLQAAGLTMPAGILKQLAVAYVLHIENICGGICRAHVWYNKKYPPPSLELTGPADRSTSAQAAGVATNRCNAMGSRVQHLRTQSRPSSSRHWQRVIPQLCLQAPSPQ